MPGVTAGREEGVAVPSPLTAAEEGAALPADDVLARLGSGTPGLPGDEAARRLWRTGARAACGRSGAAAAADRRIRRAPVSAMTRIRLPTRPARRPARATP